MKQLLKVRTIVLIWAAWALIMIGYQLYAQYRFSVQRPDYALFWTPDETRPNSNDNKPYLLDKFLKEHVAWDSEYYISIAIGGYDDPMMRAVPPNFKHDQPLQLKSAQPDWVSQNYAFFPFYPMLMRVVMVPLRLFGLTPVGTASLAGVLISMLGTLGGMIALFDIASDDLTEAGGIRAAFYLLIWPASMYLAQVYTEGLFIGLSFGALALARRDKWIFAAILAAFAAWTRAVGILLVVPLFLFWLQHGHLAKLREQFSLPELGKLILVFSPVVAYAIWYVFLGKQFQTIETLFFSRGLLLFNQSWTAWSAAWKSFMTGDSQARAYYLIEFGAIAFSIIATVVMLRYNRTLAIYSALIILFSLTSGAAQGMHRYVLAAPVIFLLPARLGKNEAFDRAWTLGNVLLMGIFAILFTADFWTG